MVNPHKRKIVVLISGRGSNLESLIAACQSGQINGGISAVISNKTAAQGLEIAKQNAIPTVAIDHRRYNERQSFDNELQQTIDTFNPDLVILAGFMRILGSQFTHHYLGKMLNIHPSLLPEYTGLHTHERVLQHGDNRHGASIHYVTSELDGGPVIMQAGLDVHNSHTANTLAADVLKLEHKLFPCVVALYCSDRITLKNNKLYLDDKHLTEPLQMDAFNKDSKMS